MNNYKEHFKKMKSNSHPVRMKAEKRSRASSSSKNVNTIKMGCLMALALCIAIYGFLYPESVMELAERVSIFSKSEAQDSVNPADQKPSDVAEIAADKKEKPSVNKVNSLTEVSDNANYIQYLEERKKTLDEKEKQLKDLEEKLQLEKVALEKKVEELELKRRDIASKLEGRVQEDEESVKKLVDMYSNMKPQSAAQVIASLDEELAINVLKRMKKQEAGNILNFMPPQKAKALSEKYTGY